jgi:hypothetical protein
MMKPYVNICNFSFVWQIYNELVIWIEIKQKKLNKLNFKSLLFFYFLEDEIHFKWRVCQHPWKGRGNC